MAHSAPAEQQSSRPVLAIDTSSAQGAVALYDGVSLAFRSWAAGRSHTTTLLAEVHHLLDAAETSVHDIAAIGITSGPGPFTGLRAGFGVAKGLHLATGVPLIGISTLEISALPHALSGLPIIATVGAGRGRLVWTHFQPDGGTVRETRAPRNGTAAELVAEIVATGPTIVAGELDSEQARMLEESGVALLPPPALRVRQPASLAELAWRRWQANDTDDPALLEPVYLSR